MASEKVTIELDLTLDNGTVQKALAVIPGAAKKTGGEAGKAFGSSFSGAVSSFLGNIGAVAFTKAIGEIKNAISGTVNAAKQLEIFETQFKTILGSTKAAQRQLQDLQQFAATTPFQIDGLALATRQLLSFGIEQEKIIPTLTQLGDIASGVGASIDELTIPFGRLVSTQKLTLIELDKFADRGVNLFGALSKQTGISLKNIRDEISKGKVDFSEFTKAINDLTSEGGKFFKGAEAQSKTLNGVISTLNDNIFNLQGTFGKTFSKILIVLIGKVTEKIQELTKFIVENASQIERSFFNIARSINDYVINPILFIQKIFSVVVNGLKTGVQALVALFASLAANIATPLNKLGIVSDETLRDLRNFGESSKEVFDDFAKSTNDSLSNVFDGTVYGKGEEFLSNLENNLLAAKALQESIVPERKEEVTDNTPETLGPGGAIDSFFTGFNAQTETAAASLQVLQGKIVEFGKQSKTALVNGFGSAVGSSFAAFGKALVSGENALEAFGKAFLGSIGQVLVQEGTANILRGIAISANPLTAGAGAPLIAAGAAMATFGGVLSGVAGGAGAAASGSGGAAETSFGSGGSEFVNTESLSEPVEPETRVAVNIQGNIIDSPEAGSYIIDAINRAVDGTGATIRRNALA